MCPWPSKSISQWDPGLVKNYECNCDGGVKDAVETEKTESCLGCQVSFQGGFRM